MSEESSGAAAQDESNNSQPTANQSDPGSGSPGKSLENKSQALENSGLPQNMQGKSPEEIAQMYANLEKKLGEQSGEVQQARKLQDDMKVVLQALWSDPKLYKEVENKIIALQNGNDLPENRSSTLPADQRDEEAQNQPSKNDDVRLSERNRIMREFRGKYKLDSLPKDQKDSLSKKISSELAEILDPGGSKPIEKLLSSARLDILPKLLDKAYILAVGSSFLEGGSDSNQDFASIGGFPASNSKSGAASQLTESESKTAQKLGVSPEKYAKRKQDLSK